MCDNDDCNWTGTFSAESQKERCICYQIWQQQQLKVILFCFVIILKLYCQLAAILCPNS